MFQQLATLLITRQVIGNFKEAVLPYVMDKLRLLRICVRVAEAMSPDTLQHQISRFEEQSCQVQDGTSEVNENDEMSRDPTSLLVENEMKQSSKEEIEVVHNGLTLSQAEVEAAMKRVNIFFTFTSPLYWNISSLFQ